MSPPHAEVTDEERTMAGPRAWMRVLGTATPLDAVWFVMIAALLALSPITGAGRPLAAAILGVAGAVPATWFRLYHRAQGEPVSRSWTLARPSLAVWMVLASVFVLLAPTLWWLHLEYAESIWRNPHGLFVVFFAILIARHQLRADPIASPESSPSALAFLIPGCVLVMLDAGMRSHYVAVVGMLLIIPGLSLLLLGARRTKRIAFPLAFCCFLIPLPDGLSDPLYLPTLTSEIGAEVARWFGIDSTRVGTRFLMGESGGIEVTQNCGGLSSFYSGLAFAILCAYTTKSWSRRIAILLAPYVLTAILNGLRIASLLWIGSSHGLDWKYDTPLHGMLGTLCFLLVIFGVWLLSDRRALREALS